MLGWQVTGSQKGRGPGDSPLAPEGTPTFSSRIFYHVPVSYCYGLLLGLMGQGSCRFSREQGPQVKPEQTPWSSAYKAPAASPLWNQQPLRNLLPKASKAHNLVHPSSELSVPFTYDQVPPWSFPELQASSQVRLKGKLARARPWHKHSTPGSQEREILQMPRLLA